MHARRGKLGQPGEASMFRSSRPVEMTLPLIKTVVGAALAADKVSQCCRRLGTDGDGSGMLMGFDQRPVKITLPLIKTTVGDALTADKVGLFAEGGGPVVGPGLHSP